MKARIGAVLWELAKLAATNAALCLVLGLLLGGIVVVEGGAVVVYPITVISMAITGIILGALTGGLVVRGVLRGVAAAVAGGADVGISTAQVQNDPRLSWMPCSVVGLTALWSTLLAILSTVALVTFMLVLGLFGIGSINFFWYLIVITLWGFAASRVSVKILVARCMQPDFLKVRGGRWR